MKTKVAKYFWDLNEDALSRTENILKNPQHPKFNERLVTFLSRCDKPKEVFSLISEGKFISAWPGVRRYWVKISRTSDFRDWWQTIYEQISRKHGIKDSKAVGSPSGLFFKIGRTIRQARVNKALSQGELASMIGAKQPDISMIEEGKKNITLATLGRLAKALGIKNIYMDS